MPASTGFFYGRFYSEERILSGGKQRFVPKKSPEKWEKSHIVSIKKVCYNYIIGIESPVNGQRRIQMNAALKPINIKMLGKFQIEYDGKVLSDDQSRTKQVWILLEYLLTNRRSDISVDRLIDVLWEDGGVDNPANALKNLIYRLRNLLAGLGEGGKNLILFKRGMYSWNNEAECVIDTEQMEKSCEKAKTATTEEKKIACLTAAVDIYQGDFLSAFSYEKWVVPLSTYYKNLFSKSVKTLADMLWERSEYEQIDRICSKAVRLDPFDEQCHMMKMKALVALDKTKEALEHYGYVTELFYSELGITPSEELRDIYNDIVKNDKHVEADILTIRENLKEQEGDGIRGAFFCGYEVFKNIYRIEARTIERSGQSIFVGLFTLNSVSGKKSAHSPKEDVMELLKKAIIMSLRRGDVVARFSPSQYITMLPTLTYENSEIVRERIYKNFRSLYKGNAYVLNCRVAPLEPVL